MASDNFPNEKASAAAALLSSLESVAASLAATQEALVDCLDVSVARRNASHRDTSLPHPALRAVSEVVLLLEMNRERLIESIKTIPAKAEYAPFAARLRQAAVDNPDLERLLSEAPRLTAPLSDSVPTLMQIADDLLAGRDRLLEAGRGLRLSTALPPTPKSEEWEAATAVIAKVEALLPALQAGAVHAKTDEASLHALAEIATPLVDTLSDLAHLAGPLTEKLRQLEPAVPAVPPDGDGVAQRAADVLKAMRELKDAVARQPGLAGDEGKLLWECVRQIQTESVNLQGSLLSPPKL